jgi:hypothetical protein
MSGQRTRASKYGFMASGRTRYCTSAAADLAPIEKSRALTTLGLSAVVEVLSDTEGVQSRPLRLLKPRAADTVSA